MTDEIYFQKSAQYESVEYVVGHLDIPMCDSPTNQ